MNKAIKEDNKRRVRVECEDCNLHNLFILDIEQMYPPEYFDCYHCHGPDWLKNIMKHALCEEAATWILHNRDLTVKEAWKKCTNAGWLVFLFEEFTLTDAQRKKYKKITDLWGVLDITHGEFADIWNNGRQYTANIKKFMTLIRKLFPNPPASIEEGKVCGCGTDEGCDECTRV